jgi:hypothetical protein
MNAAERIRAYLDARAQDPPEPSDTFAAQGLIARHGEHYLREVDLEVVLQMLDLVARVVAAHQIGIPADDHRYQLYIAERQVTGQ